MRVLIILTSHDRLGDTGRKTGFWLEELAAPYYVFRDAGLEITLASPKGGRPPVDPGSAEADAQTEATKRFLADAEAMRALASTVPLAAVRAADYDAVFYPGGHGPLWDLAEDRHSIALLEAAAAKRLPVGAVCHAPAVLRHAKDADGRPLVQGKSVTGFSNSEEEAAGTAAAVAFSVEDMLKENGGCYGKGPDWQPYAVTDGWLVTGQNPASSAETARRVLALLRRPGA